MYSCDSSTHNCKKDDSGSYKSEHECMETCFTPSDKKLVTNYFLINSMKLLNEFLAELEEANNIVAFNRIVLAFI